MRWMAGMLMVALVACTEDLTRPGPQTIEPAFAPGKAGSSFGDDFDFELRLGLPEETLTFDSTYFQYVRQLEALVFPQVDSAGVVQLYRAWFRDLVLQKVAKATDDAALYGVAGEYWNWRRYAGLHFGPSEIESVFRAQLGPFRQAASPKFHQAILGNLRLCRDAANLNGLANAIFWLDEAGRTGVYDAAAFQYDYGRLEADIRNGCAVVVLSNLVFPSSLKVGVRDTLRMTFQVDLGDSPVRTDAKFEVEVTAPNALLEVVDDFTDDFGFYERTVIPQSAGTVGLSVEACLVLPRRDHGAPEVCLEHQIDRQAADAPPPPPPPLPPPPPPPPPPSSCGDTLFTLGAVQVVHTASLNAVVNYEVIDGTVLVGPGDSLVSVTFPCLKKVTQGINVGGNRRMTDLSFPALTEVGSFVLVSSNPVLTTVNIPALQFAGKANLSNGAVSVVNNPALTSFFLGPVTIGRVAPSIGGGLGVIQPLALPNWNGISTAVTVDTVFFSLPAAGVPGFTLADVQAWKNAAPGVQAVCEIGAGGIRKCL